VFLHQGPGRQGNQDAPEPDAKHHRVNRAVQILAQPAAHGKGHHHHEKAVQGRGYTAEQTQNIVNLYTESQLAGLKQAMVLLIFLSILSLFMSSNLPDTKVQKVSDLKLQAQE